MKAAPDVVLRFEWLTALVIGSNLVCAVLDYLHPEWNNWAGPLSFKVLNVACHQGLSLCWVWLLTYFITRRKSNAAKWVFVVMTALSVIFLPIWAMMSYHIIKCVPALSLASSLVDVLVRVVMVWLLFTPEFENWFRKFRGMNGADPFPWVLGILGILFMVLVVGLMVRNFMGKPSFYNTASRRYLTQSIAFIELYKQWHGKYPSTLADLDGKNYAILNDVSMGPGFPPPLHQYRLLPGGKHYVLFDVGPDGVSATADDVYPEVASDETAHIGYVKQ